MKRLLSMIVMLVAAGSAAAADEYSIDAAHTQVGFSVKHMVIATVRGTFKPKFDSRRQKRIGINPYNTIEYAIKA